MDAADLTAAESATIGAFAMVVENGGSDGRLLHCDREVARELLTGAVGLTALRYSASSTHLINDDGIELLELCGGVQRRRSGRVIRAVGGRVSWRRSARRRSGPWNGWVGGCPVQALDAPVVGRADAPGDVLHSARAVDPRRPPPLEMRGSRESRVAAGRVRPRTTWIAADRVC